jgi:hypothetical protein
MRPDIGLVPQMALPEPLLQHRHLLRRPRFTPPFVIDTDAVAQTHPAARAGEYVKSM